MVFEEGLTLGLYAPSIFGARRILVAALRARRTEKETDGKKVATLRFDDREKIHHINEQIIAVEVHQPIYMTTRGEIEIKSAFQEASDYLGRKEISVINAAKNLQDIVQKNIVGILGRAIERNPLRF